MPGAKSGAWALSLLAVLATVWVTAVSGAALQKDSRLRFGVFLHQDKSCFLHAMMLNQEDLIKMRLRQVDFFNLKQDLAKGNCVRQNNSFVMLYNGQVIVTLSKVLPEGGAKFRYQVSAGAQGKTNLSTVCQSLGDLTIRGVVEQATVL